ncbi:hypothetical protein GGS20DRAFT_568497 [Poronia punctata]|nr:hypothetical protein GGS20DRAFT_568497 [Poronia punctata]
MSDSGYNNHDPGPNYMINRYSSSHPPDSRQSPSQPQTQTRTQTCAHADAQGPHPQSPHPSRSQQCNRQQYRPVPVTPYSSNIGYTITAPALDGLRSTFNLNGGHPHATIHPGPLLVDQDISIAEPARPPDFSSSLSWNTARESPSQKKNSHFELTPDLTPGQTEQSNMRVLTGSLNVLSAEQYDDGRYERGHRLAKHGAHSIVKAAQASNPKKRARKVAQNEQSDAAEEVKRARGRPRLETGDQHDMRERRKEQIRLAQRAYRNRKETAISDLEARVAELEAGTEMLRHKFQSLLLEYVDQHSISVEVPELRRRLQQFRSLLGQMTEPKTPRSEVPSPDAELHDVLSADHVVPEVKMSAGASAPPSNSTQAPQQLYGGIIVTHEPEVEETIRGSSNGAADKNKNNEIYTVWVFPPFQSLALPDSGAHFETTLARKLHRRATENAAKLLTLESVPYEIMHRAFGFVRNYTTLDEIKDRVMVTLAKRRNEDLNMYMHPFHHMGGSGTHFMSDEKNGSYPTGAPFPTTGLGMGPFTQRVTMVRDELLDTLQHTQFPGWQGDWYDSYDVEKLLESFNLPPEGEGFVDVPPGDFYHDPLENKQGTTQDSVPNGASTQFTTTSPSATDPMLVSTTAEHAVGSSSSSSDARYPSSVSSIGTMFTTVPVTAEMWNNNPSTSMAMDVNFFQSLPGGMTSPLAFDNIGVAAVFDLQTRFSFLSQPPKRVWFSLEKFIETLGSEGTCAGRGPAFRKHDIVAAFWKAARSEPE